MDITDRSSDKMIDGPLCTARVGDLGYAIGSALWTAATLMVDARPFASMGMAAQKLGYCRNSGMIVGIPVAAKAKNPYVDVNVDYHLINMDKVLDNTRKIYQTARIIRVLITANGFQNLKRRMGRNKHGTFNRKRILPGSSN